MAYRPFGIAACQFADRQLDLFAPLPRVEAAVAVPVVTPKLTLKPAVLPPLPIPLANHGPWPGLSAWSWLHAFALHQHTDARVYTIHPAFDDAPFLDGHAAALGYRPVYNECMSMRRREGEHRFAGDFATTKGWRELLDNRHLTTPRAILEAVADGVYRYQNGDPSRRLDHRSASAILLELGSVEPEYGSDFEMIDAVVSQSHFPPADLEQITWRRIHAWELRLVRFQKGVAVSIYDEEKAAA